MKVLQVSPYDSSKAGGSQGFCFDLSKRLYNRGYGVEVWTSRLPKSLPKVDYSQGFVTKRFFCPTHIWQLNPTVLLLHQILKRIKEFDIVHVHSYVFFSSNQLAFYRLLKKFPYVLHLHGGFGDLHSGLVGSKRFVAKRLYDSTVGKMTIKCADKIISVSRADAEYVMERYNIDADKIVVIPNAVDTKQFSLGEKFVQKIVCYVGRLTEWKGSSHMPYIFNSLANEGYAVRIVGYGPEKEKLRRLCNNTVEFVGCVPKHEVPKYLRSASCLVLPSFMEGLPTVCLEALSCGVPSVAYDVGGTRECVRNGETGFVVSKGDKKLFVAKTLEVLENGGVFRKNCRSIAEKEYDWEIVTDKIVNVYTNLLNKF